MTIPADMTMNGIARAKTALEINDLHTERLFAIFDKDENN